MNSFCSITPDRGDRKPFMDFCRHQLNRMTLKPAKSYFIEYPPVSAQIDLVDRIKEGFKQAKADGFEYAFIIESDDYYPADYFERFDLGTFGFYGEQSTVYYNLKSKTHTTFKHFGRSSLFTTGFRIKDLENFNWYAPRNRFLDISLWQYSEGTTSMRQFTNTGAIGIKHGLGLCAGKGHQIKGENDDSGLKWLKENVDSEAFDFYTDLMKKL
jgi:hypothetical protein